MISELKILRPYKDNVYPENSYFQDKNYCQLMGNHYNPEEITQSVYTKKIPYISSYEYLQPSQGYLLASQGYPSDYCKAYSDFKDVSNKYLVADLANSFLSKNERDQEVFLIDKVLEKKVAIGAEWLSKSSNFSEADFLKSVKTIDETKTYNTKILYDDLDNIEEVKGFRKIIKTAQKFLGIDIAEETDIDSLFDQILEISPIDIYAVDFNFYHEVYHLIEHREQIKYHLKLKALDRFIQSELHEILCHEQSKIFFSSPLILHLREYLDNIFNIKRFYIALLVQFGDIINFLIKKENEFTTEKRFARLLEKG
jgi:hypothetical protein